MKMIHLVGEQPIPILMAARQMRADENVLVATTKTKAVAQRLVRLLKSASVYQLQSSENDLPKLAVEIETIGSGSDVVFNLTGGTKMMALAMYNAANRRSAEFVYVTGGSDSQLSKYTFTSERRIKSNVMKFDELLTAREYLLAHLPGYREEGIHTEAGKPTIGGRFEKAVAEILLAEKFEVISGVRPENAGQQIEIDMVIRLGNRVAIAELKKAFDARPKSGFDQLSTAGSREYLGTETGKILITGSHVPKKLERLAETKQIIQASLQSYQDGKGFNRADEQELVTKVRKALGV